MLIEKSVLDGTIWYNFTNRAVKYSISDDGADCYTVWTNRISLGPRNVGIKLMTASEMKTGAKVMQDFIEFVEMNSVAV